MHRSHGVGVAPVGDRHELRDVALLGALALAAAERIDTAAVTSLVTTLDGASQDTLRRILGVTQTGTVRLVDRLVRDGLVERRPGADGRTRAIHATEAGQARAHGVLGARAAAMTDLLGAFDDTERAQLAGLLEKLLGAVTQGRRDAWHVCRLCDPHACGHDDDRCPVTRAADAAEGAGS
jgi:DNA-binding MarR family transcriptional regulator